MNHQKTDDVRHWFYTALGAAIGLIFCVLVLLPLFQHLGLVHP